VRGLWARGHGIALDQEGGDGHRDARSHGPDNGASEEAGADFDVAVEVWEVVHSATEVGVVW